MKLFACVFPGQGSQSVGMLDVWNNHPVVKSTLEEANDALGENIGALIENGPQEALALTTNTQPAMLTAGVAAYRMWLAEGGENPQVLAGHSLGEYTALVAAGSLKFADAVQLVRYRAQAMQEAVPVGIGAMAAILGLPSNEVISICRRVSEELGKESVQAANFNDKAQTVISGHKTAVEKACELAKASGAKRALLLPVSAPFHSNLMQPAAEKLKHKLQEVVFLQPQISVINNIDVLELKTPEQIRDSLYRQAFGPVRWVETIQAIKALNITDVVECGSGKVLAGLLKRIDEDMTAHSVVSPESLAKTKQELA